MDRVFVYGTLKRGFVRHHAIADQTFLGLASTEPAYKLIDLGDYPGLVPNDAGQSIEGEVYLVDDACLARLDRIEGVADSLYRREAIPLLPPWHEHKTLTYIYLPSVAGRAEIQQWTST